MKVAILLLLWAPMIVIADTSSARDELVKQSADLQLEIARLDARLVAAKTRILDLEDIAKQYRVKLATYKKAPKR